jgi:hypothetical protein
MGYPSGSSLLSIPRGIFLTLATDFFPKGILRILYVAGEVFFKNLYWILFSRSPFLTFTSLITEKYASSTAIHWIPLPLVPLCRSVIG